MINENIFMSRKKQAGTLPTGRHAPKIYRPRHRKKDLLKRAFILENLKTMEQTSVEHDPEVIVDGTENDE